MASRLGGVATGALIGLAIGIAGCADDAVSSSPAESSPPEVTEEAPSVDLGSEAAGTQAGNVESAAEPFVEGAAPLYQRLGYTSEAAWSIEIGDVNANIEDSLPGRATLEVYTSGELTVTNTTDGRKNHFMAEGPRLVFAWPQTSLSPELQDDVCAARHQFEAPDGSVHCGVFSTVFEFVSTEANEPHELGPDESVTVGLDRRSWPSSFTVSHDEVLIAEAYELLTTAPSMVVMTVDWFSSLHRRCAFGYLSPTSMNIYAGTDGQGRDLFPQVDEFKRNGGDCAREMAEGAGAGGAVRGDEDRGDADASAPRSSVERAFSYATVPEVTIDTGADYQARLETSLGVIEAELYAEDAPVTVNSFVFLARDGYFDGLLFHRVIAGFAAQGGDPLGTGEGGPGYSFEDELAVAQRDGYGLGTLAMANSGPDTNGSQFFFTVSDVDLPTLYSVFGRVTSGFEVLEAIAAQPTDPSDRPIEDVFIRKVEITGP